MSDGSRDELIKAQQQVIGILFEVVKRLQENNTLDEEYLGMVSSGDCDPVRIQQIQKERLANADVVGRLLQQLDT